MQKKYDFRQAEKEMQEFWKENGIYKFDPDSTAEIFSIDTPPPTVSGSLHIGHIFSYTQAEIIARFKRMQGYNVFYPFGFDDNGLRWETDKSFDIRIILFGEKLKEVIYNARKYKTENALFMKAEIEKVVIDADEEFAGLFGQTVNDIKACCHAKLVEINIVAPVA